MDAKTTYPVAPSGPLEATDRTNCRSTCLQHWRTICSKVNQPSHCLKAAALMSFALTHVASVSHYSHSLMYSSISPCWHRLSFMSARKLSNYFHKWLLLVSICLHGISSLFSNLCHPFFRFFLLMFFIYFFILFIYLLA